MLINYIPLDQCVDRCAYRVNARNFSIGVFQADTNGFIGIRHKFGRDYLDTEFHWDTGPPHGTALPIEKLEMLPEDISCTEHVDPWPTENQPLFDWLDSAGWEDAPESYRTKE